MTNMGQSTPPKVWAAIIVGTGFAGLGMAIALRKQGIQDFVVLEKGQDVGGVWRDNTYPGAACDIPSHLYSFSFELSPRWSRTFAQQPEILEYLRHCARKYDILQHIRFASEVSEATFDEQTAVWTVTTRDGRQFKSRLFIVGTGQLSRPAYPKLPGMENFQGRSFHSANWDHDCALEGKRVAVVGTGASAIQFVPAIADRVSQLKVFQRSAPYILPRPDRAYSNRLKAIFQNVPWLMRLYRLKIFLFHDISKAAFTNRQWLMGIMANRPFRKLLRKQVKDPAVQAKMLPDYAPGCKRILISSDYLATFSKSHVELVTEGIQNVTANGLVTTDGRHHPADVIIYGTGFAATEFLAPMRITGMGNLDLNAAWKNGAQAYMGMTVPSFPNMFILYGPNTNLGHNSIVYMLESQIAHVMRCIQHMHEGQRDTIEVTSQAHEAFNTRIQSLLVKAVWNRCKSWYTDINGRNTTNWPGFAATFRWLARRGKLDVYQLRNSADVRVSPGVAATSTSSGAQEHRLSSEGVAGTL